MRVTATRSLPPIWRRFVISCALIGALVGVVFGSWNQDDIGWSVVRCAVLAVAFAWGAKVLVKNLMKAWMETKLEEVEDKLKEIASRAQPPAGQPPPK